EVLGCRKHGALRDDATGGPSNYPLERLASQIDFYLSLGFRGFKIGAGSHEETSDGPVDFVPASASQAADFEGRKAEFVRRHVGMDVWFCMDGHMGNNVVTWDLGVAQAVLRAVEPYGLFFFEEPLPYTDPWSYAELCRSTSVPVAGGECLTAAYEWRVFAEQDAFDIGQPDAAFTGGMLEFGQVAAMLGARGRNVATHSWASGGGFMQNLQAGRAGYLTAGVRARTAQPEAFDRRSIVGPAGQRSSPKQLGRNHVEVMDVAVGEPDPPFEVHRREQQPVSDRVAEIRSILADGI